MTPRRGVPIGLLILTAVAFLVVALINPRFIAPDNLRDLLTRVAPVVIVGCGMTMLIIAREIDISVGSLMGLCAAAVGIFTVRMGWQTPIAILATLAVGATIGLINGLLVTRGRVPSIIATLGMLTILRGITETLMGGTWITGLPPDLRAWGTGSFWGVPISVLVAVLCATFLGLMLARTAFGIRVYAAGSNPEATELSGVSVANIRLWLFVLVGVLTAIATLVSATQLSVIESGVGVGFELIVITCVVVGGTSIRGGTGTVLGTVVAALLVGSIGSALIFLQLGVRATYWEKAIQGALILAAVLLDHLARRRRR